MIRLAILALVLGACGSAHLGPDTNVASRAAFAAQRATNAARRSNGGKAGSSTATAPGSMSLPASLSSGSSSGPWQGAKGNMSLEAK